MKKPFNSLTIIALNQLNKRQQQFQEELKETLNAIGKSAAEIDGIDLEKENWLFDYNNLQWVKQKKEKKNAKDSKEASQEASKEG